MKCVTCISDKENIGYKKALKASCDYHNIALITLFHSHEWQSHRNKDSYLRTFLQSVHPEEIIFFTDGYDTFFIDNEKNILDRYRLLSNDGEYIVVSAEKNCFPNKRIANEFPVVHTPYRYLNSGGMIGKAKQLLEVLTAIEQESKDLEYENKDIYKWSNQYLWSLIYLKKTHKIILDINCILFQAFVNEMGTTSIFVSYRNEPFVSKFIAVKAIQKTLCNVRLEGHSVQNLITGTFPIHLHFAGPIMKNLLFQYPFDTFIEKFSKIKTNLFT